MVMHGKNETRVMIRRWKKKKKRKRKEKKIDGKKK